MSVESNKKFVVDHFRRIRHQEKLGRRPNKFSAGVSGSRETLPPNLPAGPKEYLAAAFKRFTDIRVTIEDVIGEGDKVVVRDTWRATDSMSVGFRFH